ncbi:conserved hypothetical protein [Magnetococcus marinus MC-1]|uniref:GapR-like DNA-binding domain-containing protein n=1 Tax=Magnetococcus marinus (strain ATCC BAA-1437 / JCM 17883 / MC-1) TaxID=156889 RepID=A0L641_MAGMM|nr:DUF2312 domain-containing protein [Magnetococcus marinus]ABK43434.1 conserved hypothetical protein [Magnetococcus marinus MC-1]
MTAALTVDPTTADAQGVAGEILIQYIERIERLEEEKAGIAEDIRDVYAEAKGNGFDVKVIRELVKIRKMEQHELDEKEMLLHLYRQAIGMG